MYYQNMNIYNHPGCCVEEIPCPTFLSTVLSSKENILLAFKKKEVLDDSSEIPAKTNVDNTDLDLTGSPLKVGLNDDTVIQIDSFGMSYNLWTAVEELYAPLTCQDARMLINMHNQLISKHKNSADALPPLWCITDEGKNVLLGALSNNNMFTRGVISFDGYNSRNSPFLKIDRIVSLHEDYAQRMCKNSTTQYEVQCIYEIFGHHYSSDTLDSSIAGLAQENGSVNFELSWNMPTYEPPDLKAKTVLSVQCLVGNCNSDAVMLWQQLALLQDYIDIINEYRTSTKDQISCDITLPTTETLSANDGSVINKVEALLNRVDYVKQLRRWASEKPAEEECDLSKSVLKSFARNNRDFTDLLWSELINCTTYMELRKCFQFIIKAITSRNVSPYVHPNNNTYLACLIRDIEQGRADLYELTGTQPIEILVEMGLQKLTRDYGGIFSECELADLEDLQLLSVLNPIQEANTEEKRPQSFSTRMSRLSIHPNFKDAKLSLNPKKSGIFQNPKMRQTMAACKTRLSVYQELKSDRVSQGTNNLAQSREVLAKLGQVHTVLDILLLVNEHLSLSPLLLKHLASQCLDQFLGDETSVKSFTDLQLQPLHCFRAPIPTKEACIEKKVQSSWRLSMTSGNERQGVQTVFHQSQRPLFPPSIYMPPVVTAENPDEDTFYHCTRYLKLWN